MINLTSSTNTTLRLATQGFRTLTSSAEQLIGRALASGQKFDFESEPYFRELSVRKVARSLKVSDIAVRRPDLGISYIIPLSKFEQPSRAQVFTSAIFMNKPLPRREEPVKADDKDVGENLRDKTNLPDESDTHLKDDTASDPSSTGASNPPDPLDTTSTSGTNSPGTDSPDNSTTDNSTSGNSTSGNSTTSNTTVPTLNFTYTNITPPDETLRTGPFAGVML
mmetsp:Transcript_31002/g.47403  ORF Transcript_31002/g.47403 Transcript_31002/m.47403 type:complete len:223 (-) Transcript_31002:2195-2863(-)